MDAGIVLIDTRMQHLSRVQDDVSVIERKYRNGPNDADSYETNQQEYSDCGKFPADFYVDGLADWAASGLWFYLS